MAKGTAAKAASGASMSKYDVEVEERLQKLEAAVEALQVDSHPDRSTTASGGNDRLDNLITKLATIPAIASYCDRDEEGNRSLGV